ncbi:hypothetical protein AGMMS49546_20160 [Spirochaetia bacterium]|nr:hypothetical protein AGMMS49546_20160 [Spirochaetia bacterium]
MPKRAYSLDEKINQLLLLEGNYIVIPPLTLYETLRGLFVDNAIKKLALFNTMYRYLGQGEMEEADWVQAARLYAQCKQSGHPMGDGDLLQAAFCIRHGYTLVTHNTKHFSHLANLSIEDWV